jgi:hypothetical protein
MNTPRPLPSLERIIAANVMARRAQFDGLTPDEIADYQAELAVQLMFRREEEGKEEVGEGEMATTSPPSQPHLVHYELGPGGPLKLRTGSIVCF